MKGLTTHVLDTMCGAGAAGMRVDLQGPDRAVTSVTLDATGRAQLLGELVPGPYELRFFAGAYLVRTDFYDVIPVRFLVDDPAQHYHVPLILSAFGYSTYRGG
jgi:5-hydroxyisourate hydrolase